MLKYIMMYCTVSPVLGGSLLWAMWSKASAMYEKDYERAGILIEDLQGLYENGKRVFSEWTMRDSFPLMCDKTLRRVIKIMLDEGWLKRNGSFYEITKKGLTVKP